MQVNSSGPTAVVDPASKAPRATTPLHPTTCRYVSKRHPPPWWVAPA